MERLLAAYMQEFDIIIKIKTKLGLNINLEQPILNSSTKKIKRYIDKKYSKYI
jgi:hypothetical protein